MWNLSKTCIPREDSGGWETEGEGFGCGGVLIDSSGSAIVKHRAVRSFRLRSVDSSAPRQRGIIVPRENDDDVSSIGLSRQQIRV